MIKSEIISASAGSGKTYAVTTELLKILLSKASTPDKILVTTFTKKAAQEIFSRILTRLIFAFESKDALELLKKDLGLNTLSKDEVALTLKDILRQQNKLKIQTIDGFFSSLGHAFAPELGLPLQWNINDTWEEDTAKLEALKSTLESVGLESLNLILPLAFKDSQSANILASISKELDILSSELILVSRDCWGLREIPEKARINLNLTQIHGQLEALLDEKQISESGLKAFKKFFGFYNEKKWEALLLSTIAQNVYKQDYRYNRKAIPATLIPTITAAIDEASHAIAHLIHNQSLALGAIFTEFLNQRKEHTQRTGLISFSALTAALALNKNKQTLSELYYRLDSKLDFVFIDEFQDTSALQWTILSPLITDIFNDREKLRAFIAVGDSKQAIYGWRGGLNNIFSLIKNEFESILERSLSSSYRSSPVIIKFVNDIFSTPQLPSLYEDVTSTWSKAFKTHDSKANSNEGYVSLLQLKSFKEKAAKEGEILSNLLNTILKERKTSKNSSIGILVRTNQQVQLVENYLKSQQIEISAVSQSKLTSFYETQIFISCFTLALHPSDNLSYHHILGCSLIQSELNSTDQDQLSRTLRLRIHEMGLAGFISHFSGLLAGEAGHNPQLAETLLFLASGLERKNGLDVQGMLKILKTASLNQDGTRAISLLTIHKSKGLEFDHVILPFSEDNFFSEKNLKLLKDQPDPFYPPSSVVRSCKTDLRCYVPELERMAEQARLASISEALCLSYVAITRAKKRLTIFVRHEVSPKVEEISLRSLVLGGLNLSYGENDTQQLYFSGKEPKLETIQESKPVEKQISHKMGFPDPSLIPSYLLTKNLTTLSPSKKISDKEKIIDKITTTQSSHDRTLGNEIHFLLSQFNRFYRNRMELQIKAKEFQIYQPVSNKAKEIVEVLINSPLADQLFIKSEDENLKRLIKTEYPVRHIIDDQLVSGRIDRMHINLDQDGAASSISLFDFKLGEIDNQDYFMQLDIYKALTVKQFRLDPSAVSSTLMSLTNLNTITR